MIHHVWPTESVCMTENKTIAAYGTWASPIDAALVAAAGDRMSQLCVDQGTLYVLAQSAAGQGQSFVMSIAAQQLQVVTKDHPVKSTVHEYGGGDFVVHHGAVYFVGAKDQCWYRQDSDQNVLLLTPAQQGDCTFRYAEAVVSPDGRFLVCVREAHGPGGVVNTLVWVPTDGSQAVCVLAEGADFYSSARINQTGDRILFLAWDHPQMPWDGTLLYHAQLENGVLVDSHCIRGSAVESIYQPEFGPEDAIYFCSDRSGYWNLYQYDRDGDHRLIGLDEEIGYPAWVLGTRRYCVADDGAIYAVASAQGRQRLLRWRDGAVRALAFDYPVIEPYMAIDQAGLYLIAASTTAGPAIVRMVLDSGKTECVYGPVASAIAVDYFSQPQWIAFLSSQGRQSYAHYYPPHHPCFSAPEHTKPPLLVLCHGGPTAASDVALNLKIQFWTSRGFAVVAVDYAGSTGYGRAYREQLTGQWGVVDVEDCVYAARHLVAQARVNKEQLLIKGSSAGGLTTLCALTFYDLFKAGVSYYGVADLAGLMAQTHKFEAHYTTTLVGEYPACASRYRDRSPVHHADLVSVPVLFLQGLKDTVVPPEQAWAMMAAMSRNGQPHAYVSFADEGHGFRHPETIIQALETELAFYASVLGFTPNDRLPELVLKTQITSKEPERGELG